MAVSVKLLRQKKLLRIIKTRILHLNTSFRGKKSPQKLKILKFSILKDLSSILSLKENHLLKANAEYAFILPMFGL